MAEFLSALGGVIGQLFPMVSEAPETAQFASEVIKFAVKPFRAGRDLDDAIDNLSNVVEQRARNPKPNPEMEKVKAQQAKDQADAKIREREIGIRAKADQDKLAIEREKVNIEKARLAHDQGQSQADADREDQRLGLEREKLSAENDHRNEDRRAKANDGLVAAGMPPDYSFEEDRKQFETVMSALEQSNEATARMVETVSENQTQIAEAIAVLARAITAPKSSHIVKDGKGNVIGAETVTKEA